MVRMPASGAPPFTLSTQGSTWNSARYGCRMHRKMEMGSTPSSCWMNEETCLSLALVSGRW
jgi:hypothetical protein